MKARPTLTSSSIRLLRRTIGLIFLFIGIIGALLPIIPGWPGLIVAIVLLGRRDPMLRRLHLIGRRGLRNLRRARKSHVRWLGHWLSEQYFAMRRLLTPRIIQVERIFG